MVCIFLLLMSIVTLSINDDYDVCRCSKCLQSKKGANVIGKKNNVHCIELWYQHSSSLQATDGSHKGVLGGYKYICTSCMEFCKWWVSKLLQELGL